MQSNRKNKMQKNTKKIRLAFFILATLLSITACSSNSKINSNISSTTKLDSKNEEAKLNRYSDNFLGVFDTASQILGYANSEEEFQKVSQLIKDELSKYHKYYDVYNNYEGINNIKTINDKAGIEAVSVDKKIIDLLKFSKEMYEKTDGKVNVAFGSVLKLWHDKREEGILNPENATLPDKDKLEEAAKHIDINKIIIDEENSTVYLEDKDMSIDVGSTAKGYATEQVARYIQEQGYSNILLSVGGNVRAIGEKIDDSGKLIPWSVGVQNPDLTSEDKSVAVLNIKDQSLVTSGIYERYYTVDGKNYHHIINPDSLFPERNYLSVSIVANDSGVADALSTAIFNMDLESGKKFVEAYEGVEAMWILADKTFVYSSGFEDMMR